MELMYSFGIRAFSFLVGISSIWNRKAREWKRGRQELFQKIAHELGPEKKTTFWFHSSSLGEYELAKPLISELKALYPQSRTVVTFFSPSGFEGEKDSGDHFFYLPEDSTKNADRFLDLVNPKAAFFAKTDLWYFFLLKLEQREIPAFLFSARFRPGQFFFKPYGSFFLPRIRGFKKIFVSDQQSRDLLSSKGIDAELSGDSRFDRVSEIVDSAKEFPEIEAFTGNTRVMVVGSCWPSDMDALEPVFSHDLDLKFIVAPHDVSERSIGFYSERLEGTIKYSELGEVDPTNRKILLIDNIGMLSSLYRYGALAYVGGGFKEGLHNILEPAAWGIPVLFGPELKEFPEAQELVSVGGGFTVSGGENCLRQVTHLLEGSRAKEAGDLAGNYVKSRKGSIRRIIDLLPDL